MWPDNKTSPPGLVSPSFSSCLRAAGPTIALQPPTAPPAKSVIRENESRTTPKERSRAPRELPELSLRGLDLGSRESNRKPFSGTTERARILLSIMLVACSAGHGSSFRPYRGFGHHCDAPRHHLPNRIVSRKGTNASGPAGDRQGRSRIKVRRSGPRTTRVDAVPGPRGLRPAVITNRPVQAPQIPHLAGPVHSRRW